MALKVGVVGMGGIGHTHCRCYKNDPLGELVAVCDLIKEKADKAAEEFGVEAFYSLKDMLKAHPELDIVDVTTSGYENGSWHYEPAMEALAAGKNVLVEKPISNDINEAREMVRFAAEQNVYLGCNLNHYFTETSEQALQLIAEGNGPNQLVTVPGLFPVGCQQFIVQAAFSQEYQACLGEIGYFLIQFFQAVNPGFGQINLFRCRRKQLTEKFLFPGNRHMGISLLQFQQFFRRNLRTTDMQLL